MLSVPGLASGVDLFPSGDDAADAIIESVSFIALLADADVLVEDFALRINFAADSFGVEVVVDRALDAVCSFPFSASEMVVQDVEG